MNIQVDYLMLLENFREHLAPERSESASFLVWYLEQYYRLDSLEAIEAVCDQGGDKGVDGIFVNDNAQTITVFQSKISRKNNSSVGDAMLRAFVGTLKQFAAAASVEHLMKTAANTQLASLIERSSIIQKIGSYDFIGEFVTNIDLDQNGIDFLEQFNGEINFVGRSRLISTYISDERDIPKRSVATFDIFGATYAAHYVDKDRLAIIAAIKAQELVKLDGIEDQSLFAFNVRGPLGNTSVNRQLTKSVREADLHKEFPFFHNGVTVIAKKIVIEEDYMQIEDYYVVNGCQSISTLHRNKKYITEHLRLLTKFIQMDPTSDQAKKITEYSNTQNGVRSRDFKSNDQLQIRIQTEFRKYYKGVYAYEIKRGEVTGAGEAISNEEAGLYLMAFDHREPWNTHRKYEVFEERHIAIFARPYVTADRIVLLKIIDPEIGRLLPNLDIKILIGYRLTRYMIMYAIRELLEDDDAFKAVLESPHKYVRQAGSREIFRNTIKGFIGGIIVDINIESSDFGDDFDYRRKLKDADWVKNLVRNIKRDFKKGVMRGKQETFKFLWSAAHG